MAEPTDGRVSNDRARGTAHINVTVPAQLLEEAKAAHPGLSPSAVLQRALREMTGCQHDDLACSRCGSPIRRVDVVEHVLSRFYAEIQGLVADHARQGRTLEGLGRRVKELGERHQIRLARELPAPGLSRSERRSAKVRDLPTPPPSAPTPRVVSVRAVDDAAG